jgi:hypothetical protein
MGHKQTNMVIPHRSVMTAESGLRRRAENISERCSAGSPYNITTLLQTVAEIDDTPHLRNV